MAPTTATQAPEAIVTRWVDAFNAQDVEEMLACLHPAVHLHPLQLCGIGGAYRGHEAVRRWADALARLLDHYVVELTDVHVAVDERVIALGTVCLDDFALAQFGAVHVVSGGLIVTARHFFSDRDLLEHLGVIE